MDSHPWIKSVLEWVVVLLVALLAALFIRTFVVSPYVVPTGSMEHTIEVGDQILAEKVSINLGGRVKAGDIVVFDNPEPGSDHDVLVKRVIALEGQVVTLQDGHVFVDGKQLDEPYAQGRTDPLTQQAVGMDVSFPVTVPAGCVWVMGDNRENSADSRYFGPVPEESLIGVAVARYWPLNRIGLL
ncbi:MAG: signal peptidase I [Coriobacteriaceae bacterium]|nr:signal peptidase I [Coriobacteriaceae bacterium]